MHMCSGNSCMPCERSNKTHCQKTFSNLPDPSHRSLPYYMSDESDDDVVEVIQVKKKLKKETDDDYSHFVAVYDIDTGTEQLEEKQGRLEKPATLNVTESGDSSCIPILWFTKQMQLQHTTTTNTCKRNITHHSSTSRLYEY
jgi:hypothetical protein